MKRGIAFVVAVGWLGCGAKVVVDGPTTEGDCTRFCEHAAACNLEGYGGMSGCLEGCVESVEQSFDCEHEAHAVLACHMERVDSGSCELFDGACEEAADTLNRCDADNAE